MHHSPKPTPSHVHRLNPSRPWSTVPEREGGQRHHAPIAGPLQSGSHAEACSEGGRCHGVVLPAFTLWAGLLPHYGNRCWDMTVGVPAAGRRGCLEELLVGTPPPSFQPLHSKEGWDALSRSSASCASMAWHMPNACLVSPLSHRFADLLSMLILHTPAQETQPDTPGPTRHQGSFLPRAKTAMAPRNKSGNFRA